MTKIGKRKMTNRFKDFGSGTTVADTPVSFKIHGEEFECYPALQGKMLLDLVANSNENDGAAVAKTIDAFFKAVLVEESYSRFETLLKDPTRIVSVETLGEITAWLVEEYSSRPTGGPEAS
jgi:hypothetical protein